MTVVANPDGRPLLREQPGRVPGEPGGCCSGPTIDGVSLTASPAALIAQKQYHSKAKVLIGSNRDELAFMTIGGMPHQLNDQMMQFTVSRTIIAGIWLAFFQDWQQ